MTQVDPSREVLIVTHTGRDEAVIAARDVADRLTAAGIAVRLLADEAPKVLLAMQASSGAGGPRPTVVPASARAAEGCELVIVLGGDGSLLRGAEYARPSGVALLGVNLGHVGFLAEAERQDLGATVDMVVDGAYEVEERMTLDVEVVVDGREVSCDFALNDASVEKARAERMLEVVVEVDGRPLSRFGADGVVFSTPTGSTAYAFSAGGPIVWPEVDAVLLVPISAHALFARPLVVSPRSVLALEVQQGSEAGGVLWCDGRRSRDLPPGARIQVRRGTLPVRLARLHRSTFTDRLVAKFNLPVTGWRGTPGGASAAGTVGGPT